MCDMIHLTIVCTSTSFNCMYVMLCHVDEWITFQHRENEKLKAKVKIAEKKTKIAEDKANKAKYVCVSQKCVVRPVLLPLAVVRPALPPPPGRAVGLCPVRPGSQNGQRRQTDEKLDQRTTQSAATSTWKISSQRLFR